MTFITTFSDVNFRLGKTVVSVQLNFVYLSPERTDNDFVASWVESQVVYFGPQVKLFNFVEFSLSDIPKYNS